MPPSRIPTARRFPQQRMNASMGGRPAISTRQLRLDIGPLASSLGGQHSPMEVFRKDIGFMNLGESAWKGRVVVEDDSKWGIALTLGQTAYGEGKKVWDASHREGHTPASLRARSAAETRAIATQLYDAVLEIYASFKIPAQGPLAPDEDDPYGDIATLGALADIHKKLATNVSFVGAVVKCASRPELGLPHPSDLEAVILPIAFVDKHIGKERAPLMVANGPTMRASSGLSGYQLELAKTMHRHEGPHFEALHRSDLRLLMMKLGWDGQDHRCEVRGGGR